MKRKSDNSVLGEYQYDALGLGRRTKKVVSSATTRYVYADQQSVEELDGSGNLRRLYAFGERIDQVVLMEAADAADVDNDSNTSETMRFHFQTQLIGNVTTVTATAQTVVESYEYDPYGKITIKDTGGSTVSSSPIGNSYTYTGRQLDEESGLYYYRARQYSPELRRFIQRDPLEYVDGPNPYAYAKCIPVLRRDPSGQDSLADAVESVFGLLIDLLTRRRNATKQAQRKLLGPLNEVAEDAEAFEARLQEEEAAEPDTDPEEVKRSWQKLSEMVTLGRSIGWVCGEMDKELERTKWREDLASALEEIEDWILKLVRGK